MRMPVYFVVQEQINDEAGLAAYAKAAGQSEMTGTPLVIDDNLVHVEGDWHGTRLVILEFEDEADFRAWYDSPVYQEALQLRLAATDSRAVLARGLS